MPVFKPGHVKKRMRTFFAMNASQEYAGRYELSAPGTITEVQRLQVSDMTKARARFWRQNRAGAQYASVRRGGTRRR